MKRRRTYEPTDFLAFARRIIVRAGTRIAEEGDPADLAELVALRDALEESITTAIRGLREQETADSVGWSWGAIGRELGMSRQGARQAYERRAAG